MPSWLQVANSEGPLSTGDVAVRFLLAALFGLMVAGVYVGTQRRQSGQMLPLTTTLVLLTMLVAMTTIVIGDSIARAFGLVGALSIVRFRTVVDDTRDTSFVIFAVVTGMAVGAGNLVVCVIGVPAVAVVAAALSWIGSAISGRLVRRLEIRVGAGRDPERLLTQVLNDQLPGWKLTSVGSARQGASLDLVYHVEFRAADAMLSAAKALGAVEGVQSVEFKEP